MYRYRNKEMQATESNERFAWVYVARVLRVLRVSRLIRLLENDGARSLLGTVIFSLPSLVSPAPVMLCHHVNAG